MNKLKYENIKTMLYALILLTAFVLPAAAQTISIASQSAGPGGTVTVPIMAINITNVGAYSLTLSYDSSVVVVDDVTAGDLGDPIWNNIAPGTTSINAFSISPQTGNVVLTNVVLRAVGTAGQTSSLTITVSEIVDNNGIPIPVTINSGTFSIPTTGSITTGNITGTVTNASSGLPIEGATVTADSVSNVTDANGNYSISIAPGTYTVTASADGYQSNTTTGVVVTSGNVTTVNFALIPSAPVIVNGTIAGTVTNASSGLPIEGATVTADSVSNVTDANGNYSISIAPGTYTVTASATGYQSSDASVTVASGAIIAQNFALTPVITAFDPADANQDRVIDMDELMNAIGLWKVGSYLMDDLMTSIGRWKAGAY